MIKFLILSVLTLLNPLGSNYLVNALPNLDCSNFSEQMCSKNVEWCNWGGPLEGCLNRYYPNNLQNGVKCTEELAAIIECGDNPFCLAVKVAEVIDECVSVVCPHVPFWAQGAACLVYCDEHKQECNKGLDKVDNKSDIVCNKLDREQCLLYPKDCIYIGCSYGCPGCVNRDEINTEVVPVEYDWKHSAFACCPAAIKDGLECGLDPLCILLAIIRNHCPQKCEADLCHNVPSTCRHSLEENILSSIQYNIQHSTSDYWGHDTSSGPDGGVEACAWAVNNIITNAGYRKVGDNPDYVPSVVDALKNGRGRQIQASQAVPGDLVVACGEQHIGVCMENNCNTIDSNSSSRRCFCWRSGFNFDNYFGCGPASYWRVEN